ncbi:phosphatase PAP2 family protein [Bacteriovorax sp. Seq25_V]|uniref:phosphatase PAP2 family protein n=1 Tax=Bacteriovorax sp. Seq25_V TaxID=1201288 RepID=UPI00038A2622|nr:phosphatase PAP2 family protein [Bacteriovorax sp. Seq25_V]EQC47735.1 PAP2 family protein [Bacteriovorax sp. Seq25_V]
MKKSIGLSLMLFASVLGPLNSNATDDFFFSSSSSNYLEQKCEWRLEGCVTVDENSIDFRSSSKRMLDDLFACKNTIEGCTEEQVEAQDVVTGKKQVLSLSDIRGRYIESSTLRDMVDQSNDKTGKKYFIPLGLSNSELLMLAATTSLGLVAFHNDQEIMDYIQDTKTEKTQEIADVANLFGKELIPPIALGSYFLGVVFKDGKMKDVGLITVTAGLATQLVTEGFKKSFDRKRPNQEAGPYKFGYEGNNSFFSGHTSGAFSLATVISEVYKEDHAWVPYVAYGVASMTAYARMHDKKHWATDVLAGAVVGHLVTKIVYRMHKNDDSNGGFIIIPSYDFETGTYMINFAYSPKRPSSPLKCAKMPDGKEKIAACIQEAWERSNK